MPSFALFKSRNEETNRIEIGLQGVDVGSDVSEKKRRRTSSRTYFQKLLRSSSLTSDLEANHLNGSYHGSPSVSLHTQPIQPKNVETTLSSLYKPLPPIPFPDNNTESDTEAKIEVPAVKQPRKLERIITPLAVNDLHQLFSGAPQFSVHFDQEGHFEIPPTPTVLFPWDSPERIKDLRDYKIVHEPAWACVTKCDDLFSPEDNLFFDPVDNNNNNNIDIRILIASLRFRELPKISSMQGLEPGSTGYQAALEMKIGNFLQTPDRSSETLLWHRLRLIRKTNGLKSLPYSKLIHRLKAIAAVYQNNKFQYAFPAINLYMELFSGIAPLSRDIQTGDLNSHQIRISHLIKVLSVSKLWIDFSQMKWRILLGSILWGPSIDLEPLDATSSVLGDKFESTGPERYWVVLQILLGCEVLLGLHALKRIDQNSVRSFRMKLLENEPTSSVKWTLLLARIWIENICIVTPQISSNPGTNTFHDNWPENTEYNHLTMTKFVGKNKARQLLGLLHFANEIQWPNMKKLGVNLINMSLNGVAQICSKHLGECSSKNSSQQGSIESEYSGLDPNDASIHLDGCITNLFMSGLILPGENLSHILISGVLENDSDAVSQLGYQVNPYGGFVYDGRSFWSTANIVGKILAAKRTCFECMGWVSSDIIPARFSNGWISLGSNPRKKYEQIKTKRPRIWHKSLIERHSGVIAGTDSSSVLTGDFVLLNEKPICSITNVEFLDLDLIRPASKVNHSHERNKFLSVSIPTQRSFSRSPKLLPTMQFSIKIEGESEMVHKVNLSHDVHFVTAHPCITNAKTEILQSATNPSFHSSPPTSPEMSTTITTTITTSSSGHPLYKAYTYNTIPLTLLLSTPVSTRFATLLSPISSDPTQTSLHTTSSSIPKVLVIDCTGEKSNFGSCKPRPRINDDREMLARAICSERGWNALISRRRRGCLACSIREAGALGYKVIIRL